MSDESSVPVQDDEDWILVGGCQGWVLLPRTQHADYLRAQAWAVWLGLVLTPLVLAIV